MGELAGNNGATAANASGQNAHSAASGDASGLANGTVTATVVMTQNSDQQQPDSAPVLRLQLRRQGNVTFHNSVVDNEGMGRKSSKRCCIFHKQKAFGESSTESDDGDDNGSTSSSSSGGEGSGKAQRPAARKKSEGKTGNSKKIPDWQRFHS